MRRRSLLIGGKQQLPLIIRVDTTKSGTTPSNAFSIPTFFGDTYNFDVDWGDGVVTSNLTGNAQHTYSSGGVYDIKIYGEFPTFYFNNGGDKLKLLEVVDWGTIKYSTIQQSAFYGCSNLTSIATDPNHWYNGIINGQNMFRDTSLTSLPNGMTLGSLTSGTSMFQNSSLTTLPNSMMLNNLVLGSYMFYNNSLTSLPTGMTLNSLENGNYMFYNNSLTSLPTGMTLSNLIFGSNMFSGNSLTSLPSVMTLEKVTTATFMFRYNLITSAIGLKLHEINNGALFMNAANLPVNQYSNILIDIEANNPNNNVTIDFGDSQYNRAAGAARENLVLRGWSITDGGVE